MAIFRGKVAGKEGREQFMERYFRHPMFDLVDIGKRARAEWKTEKKTIKEHLDYKFIMAIEGNDVASNLKWVMSSNSVAVMPRPTYETWFMEGRLIPNYHYIEVKPDFSDVEERLNYYIQHPEEAEEIIRNAHAYVDQFRDEEREKLISLHVLDKYFKYVK
jgi:RNase adaptor protein for sRNA GlmZ degradation